MQKKELFQLQLQLLSVFKKTDNGMIKDIFEVGEPMVCTCRA